MAARKPSSATDETIRAMLAKGVGLRAVARETGATRWRVRELSLGGRVAPSVRLALDPRSPLVRSELVKILSRAWIRPSALAVKIGCTETELAEAIEHLAQSGYGVLWDANRVRILREPPAAGGLKYADAAPLVGGEKLFGVLGDTHLCSRHERLDVLNDAYDAFAAAGVRNAYHTGNIVDGHTDFNRFELYRHGVTDQAHYCLDHYPIRPGITTHFITGACHEGWWFRREGIDFGRYLLMEARARGRTDLNYLGFGEADVRLVSRGGKSCILRLMHPGGGSSYAQSYATQKIVESLQGGEKPHILLCGHFHKMIYHIVRNVHVIQTGTCQDQTPWMRGKRLEAHVGFWIVRVRQDAKGGVRQVSPTLTQFFDRGYHVRLEVGPEQEAGQ